MEMIKGGQNHTIKLFQWKDKKAMNEHHLEDKKMVYKSQLLTKSTNEN